MQKDDIVTYGIPVWNMPRLEARLQKLNKRADKLGCDPISIRIHEEKMVQDPRVDAEAYHMNGIPVPMIKMYKVSIEGASPKLAGWKFVGTLDHYSLPGKVIVNTVPGEAIASDYHDSEPVCNHCNKIRYRKETFVVENEEGETMQVGRQCVKDFLGHNPQGLVGFLNSVYNLFSDLDDEDGEFYGRGSRGEYYINLIDVLKITAGVIRTYGWVPRSSANVDEGREATAGRVSFLLEPPYGARERKFWDQEVKKVGVNDADLEEANKALEWLSEQEGNNEYMHNLKMIAEAGQLTYKLLGYACSIVAAYHRAMEKLKINLADKKVNEWIEGEVKQRIETIVKVVTLRNVDSYFGLVELHRMLDDNGRTIVWFANGGSNMEEGKRYRVAATIKKLDEYNGWKQTTVTRVRVLEELDGAESSS